MFVCISIVAFSQVNPNNKDTGEVRKPNGDPIPAMPLTYIAFRSTFIPADHPGLANKKLEPINPQPKVFVMPALPPSDKK